MNKATRAGARLAYWPPASSIEGKALIIGIWCRCNPVRRIDERDDLLHSRHLLRQHRRPGVWILQEGRRQQYRPRR